MAAAISASDVSACIAAYMPAVKSTSPTGIAAAITVAASIAIAPTVSVPATPAAAIPAAVVPGARTDEHSAHEPIRTVVSIGRALIGIVAVITPLASWRAISDRSRDHIGTDAYTYRNLGIRR
jgi:hypothetical protein